MGNVTDVNVVSRGLGGIASEVEVKGDGGSYKIKGQSQVRSMLGNTELVIKKQDGSDMTGTAAFQVRLFPLRSARQRTEALYSGYTAAVSDMELE